MRTLMTLKTLETLMPLKTLHPAKPLKTSQPYNLKTSPPMKIPGVSFSWKRALGISEVKRKISKKTGIPLTKSGLERKIGSAIIKAIFKK